MSKLIELETYKYNNKGEAIAGESKIVKVNRDWLVKALAPVTVEDFLDEYTYDDVEYLLTYRKMYV